MAGEAATLAWSFVVHRRWVVPRVRAARRAWGVEARGIPDATLREAALSALEGKSSNVEAVGVFALLAPRRRRAAALRAIAALQVAVDYLDTLEEAGIDPAQPLSDGGYLAMLEEEGARAAASLPSHPRVAPFVERALERCKQGQRQTHAAARHGPGALRAWAEGLGAPPEYRWWEVAAGASSSVAAHALLAAAADPRTDDAEAAAVDAVYFPPAGALTVLLDDLVDRERDRASGEHSYVDYYAGAAEAGERLATLVDRARRTGGDLRHRRRHAVILAGIVAFYLDALEERSDSAAPIRDRLLEVAGGTGRMALTAIRLRR